MLDSHVTIQRERRRTSRRERMHHVARAVDTDRAVAHERRHRATGRDHIRRTRRRRISRQRATRIGPHHEVIRRCRTAETGDVESGLRTCRVQRRRERTRRTRRISDLIRRRTGHRRPRHTDRTGGASRDVPDRSPRHASRCRRLHDWRGFSGDARRRRRGRQTQGHQTERPGPQNAAPSMTRLPGHGIHRIHRIHGDSFYWCGETRPTTWASYARRFEGQLAPDMPMSGRDGVAQDDDARAAVAAGVVDVRTVESTGTAASTAIGRAAGAGTTGAAGTSATRATRP